ncbi:MAG: hypothetical protein NXH85_14880 [Pseudomonadaceae bacterium]|nr:hypothetical protein [Pseudomonadaceae bacterium]
MSVQPRSTGDAKRDANVGGKYCPQLSLPGLDGPDDLTLDASPVASRDASPVASRDASLDARRDASADERVDGPVNRRRSVAPRDRVRDVRVTVAPLPAVRVGKCPGIQREPRSPVAAQHLDAASRLSRQIRSTRRRSPEQVKTGRAICQHLLALLREEASEDFA